MYENRNEATTKARTPSLSDKYQLQYFDELLGHEILLKRLEQHFRFHVPPVRCLLLTGAKNCGMNALAKFIIQYRCCEYFPYRSLFKRCRCRFCIRPQAYLEFHAMEFALMKHQERTMEMLNHSLFYKTPPGGTLGVLVYAVQKLQGWEKASWLIDICIRNPRIFFILTSPWFKYIHPCIRNICLHNNLGAYLQIKPISLTACTTFLFRLLHQENLPLPRSWCESLIITMNKPRPGSILEQLEDILPSIKKLLASTKDRPSDSHIYELLRTGFANQHATHRI